MPENKELLKDAVREGMPDSTIGIGRPSNALNDINPRTTPVGNPRTPDQLISTLYLACKCSVRSMDSEREARKKCQRCYLVWRVVQRYFPGWALRWIPYVSYKYAPNNALEVHVYAEWKGDYHGVEAIHETTFYIYTVSFYLKSSPGPPIIQAVQQQSPPLTINSNSSQCFSFIKERLENCRTRHSSCIPKKALPLPTRIIVVGNPCEEPTLHDMGNVQGPYAILSYCWGKSQNLLKTTSTSLDKHKKSIPLAQLPKTIRDAVYITRELAIDYLWVDSLCILQDSVQDWEVESAKMGEYFKNAHITIAASAASHAQDGILRARRGITQSVKEEYELVDGIICNIVIQERNHSYEKLESFVQDFGPLSKRGWAFQENVLSTRTVHYTDSELVWECCTETISEDGSTLGRNQHSILAYNMQNHQSKPSRLWRDLVETYTRRDLTYPSDRLPGIAGIAQIMQSRTGFQYIAGLWKETLVLDLLWSTSWPHYNTTPEGLTGEAHIPRYEDPPVTLRGPSWSWASTTAAVCFAPFEDVLHHDQCATIKDVNCKAEGDNLFGEVIHGSLQLVGLLRQLHFKCSDPQSPYTYQISTIRPQNPDDYWIHTVHSDDKVETAGFTPDKLLIGKEASEYRRLLDKPVWCLGICKSYGVILRESTVIDGAYTRIGLCENVGSLLQGAHTKLITIT